MCIFVNMVVYDGRSKLPASASLDPTSYEVQRGALVKIMLLKK